MNTGFRLVSGSWKIMAMSLPRIFRISSIGIDRISRPSNQTSLPATISAGGMSSSRMIVRAVTLLPRARFADDPEALALLEAEAHPVDGRDDAVEDLEVGLEVPDVEEEVRVGGACRRTAGRR